MISRIGSNIYLARAQSLPYSNVARQNNGSFAQTFSTLMSGNNTAQKAGGVYHSQTIAGQSYPLAESPNYAAWDKEDAYCDILKRYNLLNMLSKEKASELGLGNAYQQMTDEINAVLYGGDPIKMGLSVDEIKSLDSDIQQRLNRKVYCEMYGITSGAEYEKLFKQDVMSMYDPNNFNTGKNGTLSDDVQIYQILSRFDLTEQKNSLIGTISGRAVAAGIRFSGVSRNINVFDYLDFNDTNALRQRNHQQMTNTAYAHYIAWNDFIRELYSLK